ncbi:hypothetical protein AgCh_003902 [Apium graveolens]
MDQDKDNNEHDSEGVSKKRTRGPMLCTKLKRRMVNQNLECSISFDEYGDPIGDMLKDFRSYIGSVARVQADINIESWDQVDQGLKDSMWDDIKGQNNVYFSVHILVFSNPTSPVPCDEHETVGNAAGSFVQWPKDLVTLGQEPILLEKKKSDTSLKKNVQVPKKVESKGSVTPIKKTPPLLDDDIHSSEHCRSLRFLLTKRPPTKKSEVFKYEENGEDPIYITPEDVDQFLKMSWLNISVLEIFLK